MPKPGTTMTTETTIKDTSANPAPLGLLAFGMTTVLLNLHTVGFYPNNATILGMGLFVGGLAQVFAGLLESKKGNTFGTTAFVAFGTFWLSLVAVWVLPELGLAEPAGSTAMVAYLAIWGLFTLGMFVGTLRLNHALQVIFGTLVALFWLLALGDFTGNAAVTTVAGVVGIVCGLSALYTAIALVLNEVYGHTVFPIGPVAHRPERVADGSAPASRGEGYAPRPSAP